MKILIVEDNPNLRKLIKEYFERKNFLVDYAEDGKKALEQIYINSYDCILLDLNLPEIDGIEVAKKIKGKNITTPIVMLTARTQLYDKLEGFDTGADDYITKPFDMKELLARVKAVIRRYSSNKNIILKFNNMNVYPEENKLKEKEQEILLSNKEMGILEYILRNQGKIISTEELLEHVWDRETNFLSDTVKTHMKTLRQKIDPQKKHIKTIRGKGYIYEKN